MPNGKDMMDKLEFENMINSMEQHDLLKRLALMLYDHCEDQRITNKVINSTKKRSYLTMYCLIVLIILLITLGIIDPSFLRILGV